MMIGPLIDMVTIILNRLTGGRLLFVVFLMEESNSCCRDSDY